jgi:MFS family permease
MSLYQSLYFMSLVGGLAGLSSWLISVLLSSLLPATRFVSLSDLVSTAVLGMLIGGFTVGFSDHWSGNRAQTRLILAGMGVGLLAGLLASLLQIPITNNLGPQLPTLTRIIAWMLAGFFIGLGLGLRWLSVNRSRPVHSAIGGLLGGTLGGTLFAGLGGQAPDLSQATGFVLTGVGISLGVSLAPILLRDGVLQFISSGDVRAQSKFGPTKKEWEIQDGDYYVIGSLDQSSSRTRYRPEVEIYIPDATIAERHALLFSKEGRFYLTRHPDVAKPVGMARYLLRVRGRSVESSSELRSSEDILIGRTALRFVAKQKRQQEA